MPTPSIEGLREMSEDDLIREHDNKARNTTVTPSDFLNELARREQAKQTDAMLKYTRYILWMTVIITFATLVNVAIAYLLFRRP